MVLYGFIGCGQMAEAMISGMLKSKLCTPDNIIAYDPHMAQLHKLKQQFHIKIAENNSLVANSNVIILAVKPVAISTVCKEIAGSVKNDTLVVSIAAGVTIATMENVLPKVVGTKIVRVMPNTPALLGLGASGYCLSNSCNGGDEKLAAALLSCIGIAFKVDSESYMDAICGLSGSGPAYVYLLIEAMADGGVYGGLPRPMAVQLAAQTVFGAAAMVLQSKQHSAQLKDSVTSPGGTTAEGLLELERNKVRFAVTNAVICATKKSAALGAAQLKSKL